MRKKKYSAAYKKLVALGGSIKERVGDKNVSESHDQYIGEGLYREVKRRGNS